MKKKVLKGLGLAVSFALVFAGCKILAEVLK